MHGSAYSRAADEARERAANLGHTLGRWDVIRTAAYAACSACGSGVSVLFYSPVVTLGNAVDMPCEHGEQNVAPPVKPEPPKGAAKRIKRAPVVPPADDVPFPIEGPRRDAVVCR